MKLTIFQPDIRAYRVPLFESISSFEKIDCCVIYGKKINETPDFSNYKAIRKPAKSFKGIFFQFKIKNIAKESDVNVVPYDLHWLSAIFWCFWHRKNSKFVLWGHGFGESKIAKKIKVWLASKAHSVIVYSNQGKEQLVSAGADPQKIHVAINTMFVSNSEDCSGFIKKYFLYVGRLQERKGLYFLLECFSKYKKEFYGRYNLFIVGDGLIKEELIEKCVELKITDSVFFKKGTTDDRELANFFSEAVAYVSPCHVGLGVLHAFSYGVPVLTIKNRKHAPEFEWIKDGYNGYLSGDNILSYMQSLKDMDDEPVAVSLGKNAYCTYSKEAGPDKMLDGFKKAIYER